MKNKDFFGQIKETLADRHQPYDEGAWEEFCRERKRTDDLIVLWRYAGIAAVFLLMLGCLWFSDHVAKQTKPNYVKRIPADKTLNHGAATPPAVADPDTESRQAIAVNSNNHQSVGGYVGRKDVPRGKSLLTPKNEIATNVGTTPSPTNSLALGNRNNGGNNFATDSSQLNKKQADKPVLADMPIKKIPANSHPLYDSLVKRPTESIKKSGTSLLYAVAVHPAVGNKKMSIGAGLEVAYPFNEHLSLGSGLSFASLHAETTPGSESGLKQLQSSDLDVTGIEIPLTLSYRVKNGFYLNAGVSAIAVLSNQLSNNYLVQNTQTVPQFTSAGIVQQTLQVVNIKSTEQSTEQLSRYLGFYTFTIGKKQSVGKNLIDFGPFLKVPFNPVSSQNVRFTQGGFRLSFGF
ncbi:outer membrane beta-barrel protein [Mucilaginibacter sp. dw_454]|uniref:outer membrane beta-barrel protein n=1 Tax=Mucilaginibacter sp. dw_454 TaxID=2720079 RepID=UPI001BD69EE4|nr:outer membrane beta-barrel protein [Mucilaginibacter sp. dw_454]